MKIFYIANHQLPTTKAHGLQIMKMCEAFRANGADCELVIPKRLIDPGISELDPFLFYGVKKVFKITYLNSFDFIKWGSGWLGRPLFWLQQLSFGYSARRYLKNKDGIIYSRDPFSLYAFSGTSFKLYWEAHNFPSNINSKFYKDILKRINGLIVISEGLKNKFSQFYNKEILLASDAVDVGEFDINISQKDARTKLNLPLDKKIAMYVGHLYKWKGVDILIKAAKFLKDNELIIIVGGLKEDREFFFSAIPERCGNKVRFIDYVAHNMVPIYLKSADCLILTGKSSEVISRQYTSPLKLFEYMVSKRPIIAQNLPSFREILNSDNAILIEPDNSEKLAEGMWSAFYRQDLAERTSKNAFEMVRNITWNGRAIKICDYLEGLAK